MRVSEIWKERRWWRGGEDRLRRGPLGRGLGEGIGLKCTQLEPTGSWWRRIRACD